MHASLIRKLFNIVHVVVLKFRFLFATVSSEKVSCYTTNFHQVLNVNLMKKEISPGQGCGDQKVPRGGGFDGL